jgi:hypothetical protein
VSGAVVDRPIAAAELEKIATKMASVTPNLRGGRACASCRAYGGAVYLTRASPPKRRDKRRRAARPAPPFELRGALLGVVVERELVRMRRSRMALTSFAILYSIQVSTTSSVKTSPFSRKAWSRFRFSSASSSEPGIFGTSFSSSGVSA